MYVYIIQAVDTNLYKIGKSQKPYNRINNIKTACPYKINIKWFIEYDDKKEDVEKDLHNLFKESHQKGEWFEISNKELFEILKKNGYENRIVTKVHKFKNKNNVPKNHECFICKMRFDFPYLLARHQQRNRFCGAMQNNIEHTQKVEIDLQKYKSRCKELRNALRSIINDNTELEDLREKIQRLEFELQEKDKTIEILANLLKK